MYKVLCDSCFWFGLLDPKDSYHYSAVDIFEAFESIGDVVYLMPYPSLYETLKTDICKNQTAMETFNRIVSKNCERIADDKYRDEAFNFAMSKSNYRGQHYSLVDVIIRSIIEDNSVKKDFLVTSNTKDFKDVADIHRVPIEEILNNEEFAKKP